MQILLADDHVLVRDALKSYIERLAEDATVHAVSSFPEAYAVAQREAGLELIVLDLRMPGMNGLDGLKRMRALRPNTPVVIMSGLARQQDISEALEAGAAGFFPKTLNGPALVSALRLVLAGERFVPSTDHAAANTRETQPESESTSSLTVREREVLELLTKGLSNKEIARQLDLQEVTIKLHVRGICRKLGAKNRTQAALLAVAGA
ncbi:MAG: DNA-binding response regulator [Alphaproteobacteria bacterium]|nr:MAG: DNA-binding response regulator [Alphaproteobacteria bacterium]